MDAGPRTVPSRRADSSRPSSVQIAPVSLQAVWVAGRTSVTSPLPAGCTSSSMWARSPLTRRRSAIDPPFTATPVTKSLEAVLARGSLNRMRALNSASPSWLAGRRLHSAVSGFRTSTTSFMNPSASLPTRFWMGSVCGAV